MTLPIIQLPSDVYKFDDGQTLEFRGLSRAEALQVAALGADPLAIEIHTIAAATGTTKEEAEEWIKSTPQDVARDFFNAIAELSGLREESGKDEGGDSLLAKLMGSTTSSPKISENP